MSGWEVAGVIIAGLALLGGAWSVLWARQNRHEDKTSASRNVIHTRLNDFNAALNKHSVESRETKIDVAWVKENQTRMGTEITQIRGDMGEVKTITMQILNHMNGKKDKP